MSYCYRLAVRSTSKLTQDQHSTWSNPILEILFCFVIINTDLGMIIAELRDYFVHAFVHLFIAN